MELNHQVGLRGPSLFVMGSAPLLEDTYRGIAKAIIFSNMRPA
jgi:hypothetical protein